MNDDAADDGVQPIAVHPADADRAITLDRRRTHRRGATDVRSRRHSRHASVALAVLAQSASGGKRASSARSPAATGPNPLHGGRPWDTAVMLRRRVLVVLGGGAPRAPARPTTRPTRTRRRHHRPTSTPPTAGTTRRRRPTDPHRRLDGGRRARRSRLDDVRLDGAADVGRSAHRDRTGRRRRRRRGRVRRAVRRDRPVLRSRAPRRRHVRRLVGVSRAGRPSVSPSGAPVTVLDAEDNTEIGSGTITASRWEDMAGGAGQWNCSFDFSVTLDAPHAEFRIKVGALAPWLAAARPDGAGHLHRVGQHRCQHRADPGVPGAARRARPVGDHARPDDDAHASADDGRAGPGHGLERGRSVLVDRRARAVRGRSPGDRDRPAVPPARRRQRVHHAGREQRRPDRDLRQRRRHPGGHAPHRRRGHRPPLRLTRRPHRSVRASGVRAGATCTNTPRRQALGWGRPGSGGGPRRSCQLAGRGYQARRPGGGANGRQSPSGWPSRSSTARTTAGLTPMPMCDPRTSMFSACSRTTSMHVCHGATPSAARVDRRGRHQQRRAVLLAHPVRAAGRRRGGAGRTSQARSAPLRSPSTMRYGLPSVITWRTAVGCSRASRRA